MTASATDGVIFTVGAAELPLATALVPTALIPLNLQTKKPQILLKGLVGIVAVSVKVCADAAVAFHVCRSPLVVAACTDV
jgi:hypothetical protein